jgi:hypothetical protein
MSPVTPPKLLFPPSSVPSPNPIPDHASSSTPIDETTLKIISVPDIVLLPEDNHDPDPNDIELEPRDGGYYITLTVTTQTGTYITSLLLGDSFPTSSPTSDPTPNPIPTPEPQSAVSTSTPTPSVQHPGISTGAIAGIIIGVLGGLSLLVGAFYIYLLRSKKYKKGKRRKKRSPRPRSGKFKFVFPLYCVKERERKR